MKTEKLREKMGVYIGKSKINIGKFKTQYAISCGLLVLVGILISIVDQNMMPLSGAIITCGPAVLLYIMQTQATKSDSMHTRA